MRIAQVSPLYESVPPHLYGGTERVVSYLTEELVRQGHQVTLFASGDSVTRAELRPVSARSLRLDPTCVDQLAHHMLLLERVASEAHRFDLIHWHVDYLHFALSRRLGVPRITTLHGRLDLPDLVPLYGEFRDEPVVSISDAQRTPLPEAHWVGTVYHGLPPEGYRFQERPSGYFAFLGRISPEKRVDRAIRIARAVGRPLRIAAKVDAVDRLYFEQHVRPLLNDPLVEYVGEVGEQEKSDFLGGAAALLFPIDWPEPFGLVMIEAMACGTPVVAFDRGSVREVLEDGVTGFIVNNMEDAVGAARRALRLPRRGIRDVFDRRFTAERMAADYLRIYRTAIARHVVRGEGRKERLGRPTEKADGGARRSRSRELPRSPSA